MKQLYLLTIEQPSFQMCVIAESEEEAVAIGREEAHEEALSVDIGYCVFVDQVVTKPHQIPEPWRDGMPYTAHSNNTPNDNELTAAEWLVAQKDPP